MSGVSAGSDRALQEALIRLGEGRPLRTNGALTVAGLAAEAGVSRSTANRSAGAVEALRSLQLTQASEAIPERCPFDERQARKEIAELRRRHAEQVSALELSIDTLAQHVQVLTLDNERLRHALAQCGKQRGGPRHGKGRRLRQGWEDERSRPAPPPADARRRQRDSRESCGLPI